MGIVSSPSTTLEKDDDWICRAIGVTTMFSSIRRNVFVHSSDDYFQPAFGFRLKKIWCIYHLCSSVLVYLRFIYRFETNFSVFKSAMELMRRASKEPFAMFLTTLTNGATNVQYLHRTGR